jgi:membrane-bound metal-dependent hydrolase YbcI (DUF457 family)
MNRQVHLVVGAGLFLLYYYLTVFPHGGAAGLFAPGIIAAAAGSLFPDLPEPATNARHRGIFHSRRALKCALLVFLVTAGSIVVVPALSRSVIPVAVSSFCLGYASHLLLDSLTRAGLPG